MDVSPQPTGQGEAVTIAEHKTFGRGLWWLTPHQKPQLLVREGSSSFVAKLEYFAPQANDQGHVVFRAIGQDGKRRVLALHKDQPQKLKTVLEQGQTVKSNTGPLRVIDRKDWPAFSGRPCLSIGGHVFVHAVLETTDGSRNAGSGVFWIRQERVFN
jgi:hypothetical protein